MGASVAAFRPNAVLTSGALVRLVAGLTRKTQPEPVDPAAPVTITQLDAALVRALGLGSAASSFLRVAREAGLQPPGRFGTEVTARLLGLRVNHPIAQDGLELLPADPATRAEAAYSAARILGFAGTERATVEAAAGAFALPVLTPWQRRVLATGVRFIGYPYVWGGTSEKSEAPSGVRARGGFDCSGFVWRIFKLQAYAGAPRLAAVLRGRTTYQMSGEVTRTLRITIARLRPADVLFFGRRGVASTPSTEVDHVGVYLGGRWMIHSSSQGVALVQLAGSYRTRFAWARRPLAEARLEP
jgi:cell wall-associated NlpC family hydrolase